MMIFKLIAQTSCPKFILKLVRQTDLKLLPKLQSCFQTIMTVSYEIFLGVFKTFLLFQQFLKRSQQLLEFRIPRADICFS